MRFLGWVLLLVLLVLGVGAWYVHAPYGPAGETFVDIPAGTGSAGIARKLEEAGVIRSRYAFEFWRKYKGGTLKAGEYRFQGEVPVSTVYGRIARGDVYTRTLVIPEGFTIFDIARVVGEARLADPGVFLAAEKADTALIADIAPRASSLEGYLFPDTYRFSPHATPREMLAAMVKRFRQVTAQLGMQVGPGMAWTVTLASLVEKEVHVDAERSTVASVFENRMELGMPLQTDPAVAYAAMLDGRWRGTIYQSDLQSMSPYNTYKHVGLPPGPIANPGVAALRAALHPASTQYLYFVADAGGHTQFSVDLAEHEKQVAAYRAAGGN